MKIHEIFYNIQGEGVYQGLSTVFIRLQGCNLLPKCCWCDTTYAQLESNGQEMTVDEITKEVLRVAPEFFGWVCITGGEPLWQADELEVLIHELAARGHRIEVETNGSLPKPTWWTLVDSWCADIKCPSSGVAGISKEDWFKTRPTDQVKFVCGTEEDLEFAGKMIQKHLADKPVVLVSPVITLGCRFPDNQVEWGRPWMQRVVEFCLTYRVRFSLQWHKVIWGNKKGV